MTNKCVAILGESFCFRAPNETESSVILILTLVLLAGQALRNRNL